MAKTLYRVNYCVSVIPAGMKDGLKQEPLAENKYEFVKEECMDVIDAEDGGYTNRQCRKCEISAEAKALFEQAAKLELEASKSCHKC